MVVHHIALGDANEPAMVGFVVSKAVGNAVTRNSVKRRLRAAMAHRIDHLPTGSTTVLRALPAAATVDYAVLERDVDRCLDRLSRATAKARA